MKKYEQKYETNGFINIIYFYSYKYIKFDK